MAQLHCLQTYFSNTTMPRTQELLSHNNNKLYVFSNQASQIRLMIFTDS